MRLGEFLEKLNSARAAVHRLPTRAMILTLRVMPSSLATMSNFYPPREQHYVARQASRLLAVASCPMRKI